MVTSKRKARKGRLPGGGGIEEQKGFDVGGGEEGGHTVKGAPVSRRRQPRRRVGSGEPVRAAPGRPLPTVSVEQQTVCLLERVPRGDQVEGT